MPLLPLAVSATRIDASSVIVSSSGWAHGYRTNGIKLVYCYSPARWLYQQEAYLGSAKLSIKRVALSVMAPMLRRWDRRRARTADGYLAISTVVKQRIWDAYGIDAEVVPAPHSVDTSLEQEPVDISDVLRSGRGFMLCVSRLLPYKNVDLIVEAANARGLPLVLVGTGPEERRLRALSGGSVKMLKDLSDAQMRWLYARCSMLLSASYEDFGLTPIEAASFGKPSVVLRWGGFLDTLVEGVTGEYFDQPNVAEILAAIDRATVRVWQSETIKAHAATFSESAFEERIKSALVNLHRRSPR